jgi:hypothetical protein
MLRAWVNFRAGVKKLDSVKLRLTSKMSVYDTPPPINYSFFYIGQSFLVITPRWYMYIKPLKLFRVI